MLRKLSKVSSRRASHFKPRHETLEARHLLSGTHSHVEPLVTDTEIQTLHDSVPRFVGQDATHNVRSGSWSDPSIWSDNEVPEQNEQVRISHDSTVLYDVDSTVAIDAVEVMGELTFATNQDTSLYLNELTVMPGGSLVIGTAAQPVEAAYTSEIVFTDTPDSFGNHFKTGTVEQPGIDPFQYGNGLLALGSVTMHGAPMDETFVRLAEEPLSGTDSVVLETPVNGWQVGDRLVIPDTRQINPVSKERYHEYEPQWEELTIAGISGSTITLSAPLEFEHLGARDADETPTVLENGIKFLPHIGNLTRNVVLRSENPDGVRGHTQFFGRIAKDIRFVQFQDLGRTKVGPTDGTETDADGNITHIGTNQPGRYSDHNHHVWGPADGLDAPAGQHRDSYQVIEVGNAVVGGLKWGTAVHGTHYGLFRDNVYYNIDGSAVATEDGSETGNEFIHNFVVRVNGGGGSFNGLGESDNILEDNGDQGDGFWFAGPFNRVENNVAANAIRSGFMVYPDNVPFDGSSRFRNVRVPLFPGADLTDPSQSQILNVREHGQQEFIGNEIYGATTTAVQIWTSGDQVRFPDTATPNVITDTYAWHITGIGIRFYYAPAYVVDGWIQRGDPKMIGAGRSGGGPSNPSNDTAITHAGSRAAFSEVVGANIQGMSVGYLNRGRGQASEIVIRDSYFDNLVNIGIWKWSQAPFEGSRDMIIDNVVFGDGLNPGATNTVVTSGRVPEAQYRTVPETQTITSFNGISGQDFSIFYDEQAPDSLLPASDGTVGTFDECEGLTNIQCSAQHRKAYAGHVAPSQELDSDNGEIGRLRGRAMGITGLVYESPETRLEQPRLYVNFEQNGEEKTLYFAVTGDSSDVEQVVLQIGTQDFFSEDVVGQIDVSELSNGTHSLIGTISGNGGAIVGTPLTTEVLFPVKDKSSFRRVNQKPVVDEIADQSVRANRTLSFTITAEDPEGDEVTFSAVDLPPGATLHAQSGIFQWTPTNSDFGSHRFRVGVTDEEGGTREAEFNVDVRYDFGADTLLGDWSFDDGTASDSSPFGHDAVVVGANIESRSVTFDGRNDFIDLPQTRLLEPVEQLTIAFWAKPGQTNGGSPIVRYDSGSLAPYEVAVKDAGVPATQGYAANIRTTKGHIGLSVHKTDWNGEWDHIALTFRNTDTSGELRLYLNGDEVARNLDAGKHLVYSGYEPNRLRFGNSQNRFYHGALDDVQLHAQALSQQEISDLYQRQKALHRMNQKPVLEGVADQRIRAGETLSMTVNATDPEQGPIVIHAHDLPPGASFENGRFQWTPTIADIGSHTVRFIAIDDHDARDQTSAQFEVTIPDTLMGSWNFDDATANDSAFGNDGTVVGAVLDGGFVSFDGIDDFVELPQNALLKPVEQLSLSFWAKPGQTNGGSPIVRYDSGSLAPYEVAVKDAGVPATQGYAANIRTTKGHIGLSVHKTDWNGEWDHIALTFRNTDTSGELRLYLNGDEVARNLDAGKHLVYSGYEPNRLRFGNSQNRFYHGALDDVQLHAQALSQQEISDLYQRQKALHRMNQKPVLEGVADQRIRAGETLSMTVNATDPEQGPIVIHAHDLPPGASFENGRFQWTPTIADIGSHTVRFIAIDDHDARDQTSAQFEVTIPDTLIGSWNFDDATANDSAFGNDGTVVGAVLDGGFVSFDGIDDFVELPQNALLKPVEQLSLSFWAKPGQTNGGSPIVRYDSGSLAPYEVAVKDAGVPATQGYAANIRTTKGHIGLSVHKTDWNGEWDHIALTFRNTDTSGELRLYLNGDEVARNLDAGKHLVYSGYEPNRLRFGNSQNRFYHGGLDNVQLYGTALEASAIAAMFQQQDPGDAPWQNPFKRGDVNADGRETAVDALQIINEISRNSQRQLPLNPKSAGHSVSAFYDVSGDNFLSTKDALQVINIMDRNRAGESEEPLVAIADDDEEDVWDEAVTQVASELV